MLGLVQHSKNQVQIQCDDQSNSSEI